MTPPSILLAKQGKPEAIESLLNRSIAARGFQAKVLRKDQLLSILIEGDQPPEQTGAVAFIQQGIEKIAPANVATVRLSGQAVGQSYPEWIIDWQMNADLLTSSRLSHLLPLEAAPEAEIGSTEIQQSEMNGLLLNELQMLQCELAGIRDELAQGRQQIRLHPFYRQPRWLLLQMVLIGMGVATVIAVVVSALGLAVFLAPLVTAAL